MSAEHVGSSRENDHRGGDRVGRRSGRIWSGAKAEGGIGATRSPLIVITPVASEPSKHVVNANKVKACIGATYSRWTEADRAPKAPMALLTAVSACAREHGTEAFQDYVSIHGAGLSTLLELVERQQEFLRLHQRRL